MQKSYISFLDLMCCSFGGALLMFLIVASSQSSKDSGRPMVVVRARVIAESEAGPVPSLELGIQYRKQGESQWKRANGAERSDTICASGGLAFFFSPPATEGSGSEAVFICNNPKAGQWEVRAYVATTSSEERPNDIAQSISPVRVRVEVLGAVRPASVTSTVDGSGQFTSEVPFETRTRDDDKVSY